MLAVAGAGSGGAGRTFVDLVLEDLQRLAVVYRHECPARDALLNVLDDRVLAPLQEGPPRRADLGDFGGPRLGLDHPAALQLRRR
jgi:hypothetical protein